MYNVLIVEDHALIRFGLKTAFESKNFINEIYEASTVEEAINMIKNHNIDAVIMDLGLPSMNGIEATREIKSVNNKIKVIILTSHNSEEEVLDSIKAGANAYCLKDISPETLSYVIKNVAEGACWVDPGVSSVALNFFPKPENVSLIQTNDVPDARAQLTQRELEVLKHLVKGTSNTEIAKELIVSVHTAKAHVCSILQKLCVDDRVQAAVKAIKENII